LLLSVRRITSEKGGIMIVVSDASSKTGTEIISALLKAGERVRGIDNSRERLAALRSSGVEPAVGELTDPVFLLSAFRDAESVFFIVPSRSETESVKKYFEDTGSAFVKALRDSKVRNVYFLSSMGADEVSEAGLLLSLGEIERRLDTIETENVITFRPGYFMEHLLSKISYIKTRDVIADSTSGDTPLYLVSIGDVALKAVSMLRERSSLGRRKIELYGDRLSYRDMTRIIGTSIGIPELPYVQLLDIDMRNDLVNQGYSINMADNYVEMTHALSRGALTPKQIDKLTPNCPTRFKQFVDDVFVEAYHCAELEN
jgi:uncharacterized protein YbjT (DUF2867 family)